MKTKKLINVLAVVFLLATLAPISSCKKYEEGPSISLRTKKARITNEWKLEEMKIGGEDVTALIIGFGGEFNLNIKSDETFEQTFGGEEVKGKWKFSSDKEEVILTDDSGEAQTWTIVRLAHDEFWVKFTEDGENYEIKFEEK